MGIRTDDNIPRYYKTFFRQQGMLDSHLSHFKIVGNFIPFCKFPDTFTMLCGFDILVRNKVVRNQSDFILIKDSLLCKFIHFLYCNRACNIVAQYQTQICLN